MVRDTLSVHIHSLLILFDSLEPTHAFATNAKTGFAALSLIRTQLILWNMLTLWLCMNIQIAIFHWTNCECALSIEWNRTGHVRNLQSPITSSTGIKISFYWYKKINQWPINDKEKWKNNNNNNGNDVLVFALSLSSQTTRFLQNITLISWTSSIYHDFLLVANARHQTVKLCIISMIARAMRVRQWQNKQKSNEKWKNKWQMIATMLQVVHHGRKIGRERENESRAQILALKCRQPMATIPIQINEEDAAAHTSLPARPHNFNSMPSFILLWKITIVISEIRDYIPSIAWAFFLLYWQHIW